MKNRILVISCIVLVAIAVILVFSPILKSKPIAVEAGLIYLDTIMPDDAPDISDKEYRRHTYSLNVLSKEKYTIEVSSLSDDRILLFEYYNRNKTQLVHVDTMASATIEYEVSSAGQKIFYVEALADACPAEYRLKITKL